MYRKVMILFILLMFAVPATAQMNISIAALEDAKIGRFPPQWKTWPFKRGKTSEVYHVMEEGGGPFIRARDDKDYSLQAMRDFNWPLETYPYLNWRWRGRELPTGAREDDDSKNDSACGVYVVFGTTSGRALKYVWGTTLPEGKIVSRRSGKLKIKVLESGEKYLNTWRSEGVNVIADYTAVFGAKPPKDPSGIAILTDGNATHSAAACDYADFEISKVSK